MSENKFLHETQSQMLEISTFSKFKFRSLIGKKTMIETICYSIHSEWNRDINFHFQKAESDL